MRLMSERALQFSPDIYYQLQIKDYKLRVKT